MRLEPPVKVTREKLTFDVREIEPLLQAPPMDIAPFPPAMVELRDGSKMVIRAAKLEEAPLMLGYVEQLMKIEHDFYDIVGARVYAEILGWYRKRLKDPYTLVGLIDGTWVGFANGRLMNEDINISLHTMSLRRGLRIGAIMYYAKASYAFDVLDQDEWWATYESYNGWKRWGLGMAQPSYPWPEYQHELGGARVYYVTKKYWDTSIKNYIQSYTGAELLRPVPAELLEKNAEIKTVPEFGKI
ncbi:MAG TPA: N-acetyltransferase [Thermoflexia bacterium]|nr:N-acetyltransferase [Thermoflexia bacterium]